MTDNQWIRAVNNKGITTEGELKGGKVGGGTVRSEGRLSTGEYLQLDKTATAGTSCSPDGLVGRDSKGQYFRANPVCRRTVGFAPNGSYSNLVLLPEDHLRDPSIPCSAVWNFVCLRLWKWCRSAVTGF